MEAHFFYLSQLSCVLLLGKASVSAGCLSSHSAHATHASHAWHASHTTAAHHGLHLLHHLGVQAPHAAHSAHACHGVWLSLSSGACSSSRR